MQLAIGTMLGPYEVIDHLGSGGMGEVYRARDTRLGRDVAIKVLPAGAGADENIRRRFLREARAISGLSHPNICALFDVSGERGSEFLVMEYLSGETLAQRISRGAMTSDEALPIAIDIASALDRAHRKGVIHRDLKPSNVMVTPSGAKLLDFGLARIAAGDDASVAAPLTASETIIGTIDYMAPEQLNGNAADMRSDIFSFGVMLYEMLSGSRPFRGGNRASVIGSILFGAPEVLIEKMPDVPAQLARVIDGCLAKDPDERLQTAHDLLLQLRWMHEGADDANRPRSRRTSRRKRATGTTTLVAGATLALIGGMAVLYAVAASRDRASSHSEIRFHVQAPGAKQQIDWPVISPDGSKLVFVAESPNGTRVLMLRSLASTSASPLPGTEGATQPFWSRDGSAIAFFSANKLQVLTLGSTRPQSFAVIRVPRGASWGSDGTILYAPDITNGIFATSGIATTARQVTRLDTSQRDVSHRWPEFFPDNDHFLFVLRSRNLQRSGLYVSSLKHPTMKKISTLQSHAVVSPRGDVFFVRDHRLYRQPFDLESLQFKGTPLLIAGDLRTDAKITGATRISVASNGTIVFGSPLDSRVRLVWVDRSGAELRRLTDLDYFVNPALSSDDKTLAISRIDEESTRNSIWLVDTVTGVMRPFVDEEANADAPVWSVDGRSILYSSDRSGVYEVYRRAVGAISDDAIVLHSKTYAQPVSSVASGEVFAVSGNPGETAYWFWPRGGSAPRVLEDRLFTGVAQLSPNGEWLAGMGFAAESTSANIFLQSTRVATETLQVSPDGAGEPAWRADGRELYFVSREGDLMACAIDGTSVGIPVRLFRLTTDAMFYANQDYVPAADGKRFLVMQRPTEVRDAAVTVIVP